MTYILFSWVREKVSFYFLWYLKKFKLWQNDQQTNKSISRPTKNVAMKVYEAKCSYNPCTMQSADPFEKGKWEILYTKDFGSSWISENVVFLSISLFSLRIIYIPADSGKRVFLFYLSSFIVLSLSFQMWDTGWKNNKQFVFVNKKIHFFHIVFL